MCIVAGRSTGSLECMAKQREIDAPVQTPRSVLEHFLTPGRALAAAEMMAVLLGAVILTIAWLMVYYYIDTGHIDGYRGKSGNSMGAFLIAAVAYAGTVTWVFVVWRHLILPRL